MAREKRTSDLHAAIEIAAPGVVEGVSIGDVGNRQTWRVDYVDNATPEQMATVAAVIGAWSFDGLIEEPVAEDSATLRDAMKSEIDALKLQLSGLLLAIQEAKNG